MRQFTFVVGSPEQEANFKEEVVKAQEAFENCKVHPTLLAYHGKSRAATIVMPLIYQAPQAIVGIISYGRDLITRRLQTDE